MRLKLLVPTEILVNEKVNKIIAEAENGLFCLLPRHVDFAAALVPGILYYTTPEGREKLIAVDEGSLVKCGKEVLVSVPNAFPGTEIEQLEAMVANSFRNLDEEERRARTALARLEAGTLRAILELEKGRHG